LPTYVQRTKCSRSLLHSCFCLSDRSSIPHNLSCTIKITDRQNVDIFITYHQNVDMYSNTVSTKSVHSKCAYIQNVHCTYKMCIVHTKCALYIQNVHCTYKMCIVHTKCALYIQNVHCTYKMCLGRYIQNVHYVCIFCMHTFYAQFVCAYKMCIQNVLTKSVHTELYKKYIFPQLREAIGIVDSNNSQVKPQFT
jgi:hypothetical protein